MGRQQRGQADKKGAIKPSKAGVKKPVQSKTAQTKTQTKPRKALDPVKAKAAAAGLITSMGMGAGALNSLLADTMADLQEAGVVKSKAKQRMAADMQEPEQQAAAEMAMEPAPAASLAQTPPAPAPPRATCAEADALLASWSL
jgi:hypothetical protein